MKKEFFNLLCTLIAGLIVFLLSLTLEKLGYKINMVNTTSLSIATALICYILINNTTRNKLRHICCDYDWAEESVKFYQNIPTLYKKSFWILFGMINLAFLFHTINFMWGADDWGAIRNDVKLADGLNEGRFSAYWLQELLFNGKILPVINNLWSFIGLSLAGILLAVYWNLPQKVSTYVMIGLFFAINPYTLSWLYFAKNTLGNLWLPTFILTALILAEKKSNNINKSYITNLICIILLVTTLGTYLPSLSFIAIAITGKLLLNNIQNNVTIKENINSLTQTLANLLASIMLYSFIIIILKEKMIIESSYNTELATITEIIIKFPDLIKISLEQLLIPLPFIDITYKSFNLILVIISVFTIIFNSHNYKASLRGLLLFAFALIFSKLTYLLSATTDIDFKHIIRIDFYSLPLLYTLMISTIINNGARNIKKLAYILGFLIIFMGYVRIAYALKVWKFGFDAETKLTERIITRLEKLPEFNPNGNYKLLQIGNQSLRKNYYVKRNNEISSSELLDTPYYKSGNAKDAYNFYYQTDFLDEDASKQALYNKSIREYILNNARTWPAKESIAIIDEYIIIILDEISLQKIRNSLNSY